MSVYHVSTPVSTRRVQPRLVARCRELGVVPMAHTPLGGLPAHGHTLMHTHARAHSRTQTHHACTPRTTQPTQALLHPHAHIREHTSSRAHARAPPRTRTSTHAHVTHAHARTPARTRTFTHAHKQARTHRQERPRERLGGSGGPSDRSGVRSLNGTGTVGLGTLSPVLENLALSLSTC
jgi:hypothetical protein